MLIEEFSDEFDTLVSSYKRFKDFDDREIPDSIEFNEYEKSVFLTKAQEEIVTNLYNGKNAVGDSFESSEEIRRYLADLIAEAKLEPITNTNGIPLGVASNSKFFTLPEDLWFITYESVTVSNSKCPDRNTMRVYPVKQDEYHNIKDNPFRGPNDRRALRLDLSEGNVEIVCKYIVTEYYVRYLKRVPPIILVDLPNDMSIRDNVEESECILNESLHPRILDLAVRMALQSKGYNIQKSDK